MHIAAFRRDADLVNAFGELFLEQVCSQHLDRFRTVRWLNPTATALLLRTIMSPPRACVRPVFGCSGVPKNGRRTAKQPWFLNISRMMMDFPDPGAVVHLAENNIIPQYDGWVP